MRKEIKLIYLFKYIVTTKKYGVKTERETGISNPNLFDVYYSFSTTKPNETKISVKVSSEIFLDSKLEDILRECVLDRANFYQKNRPQN